MVEPVTPVVVAPVAPVVDPAAPVAPVVPVVPAPTQISVPATPPTPLTTPQDAWRLGLDADLQADLTIQGTKSINDLARRLVDTKAMVGVDKISKLKENASPEETRLWMKDNLGLARPDTADGETGYKFDLTVAHPDFKEQMGATMTHVAKAMFELDVPLEKGQALVKSFLENESALYEEAQKAMVLAEETAINGLKQELGSAFDHKIGIVQHALKELDPTGEATQLLEDTRLGNHPAIIKMLIKMAENMGGDSLAVADVSQGRAFVTSPEQATAEIKQLTLDKEFREKLTNKSALGHKEALDKWTQLHQIQAGGK